MVASSDLSHYQDDVTARAHDERTATAILEGRADDVGPLRRLRVHWPSAGLLLAATRRGLAPRLLGLTTSAPTSGDAERVRGLRRLRLRAAGPARRRRPPLARGPGPPGHRARAGHRRALPARRRRGAGAGAGAGRVVRDARAGRRAAGVHRHASSRAGRCGTTWPATPGPPPSTTPGSRRSRPAELAGAQVEVSVLSHLEEIPAGDADGRWRRGAARGRRRGAGGRGATGARSCRPCGPSCPTPTHVRRPAGAQGGPARAWPAGARAWRYTVDEFADARRRPRRRRPARRRRRHRHRPRPGVVGLAGGGADDPVDQHERLGHLVAGQRAPAVVLAARRPGAASPRRPERNATTATTSWPQRSVGPAHDDGVAPRPGARSAPARPPRRTPSRRRC